MVEKKGKKEKASCSVGNLLSDFEKTFGKNSSFYKHMTQSKIEFLKGVRSLLDDRIERLEKKGSKKSGAKLTKVKVE
jgi:hypothetical protein